MWAQALAAQGRYADAAQHAEIANRILSANPMSPLAKKYAEEARQVADDLRDFFKDEVFRTIIPRNIRLAEAPSYGKPALVYDVRSRGAESYIRLAKEIIAHYLPAQEQSPAPAEEMGKTA